MAVTITDQCIACGACLWECPTEAIAPGDPRPVVDESSCTECYGFFGEAQCVVVCPVEAIVVSPVEDVETLASRFAVLQPRDRPQDTWIWQRTGNRLTQGPRSHG
jgi:ferredoxin